MKIISLMGISGIILLAGLGISYGGSELATANLEKVVSKLDAGNTLQASIELDPAKSTQGVYAIKSIGDKHDNIVLRITGPDGSVIDTQSVIGDSSEALFTISTLGKHILEVTNTSDELRELVIAIGYKTSDSARVLVIAGSYVLITGMISMAATIVYGLVRMRTS